MVCRETFSDYWPDQIRKFLISYTLLVLHGVARLQPMRDGASKSFKVMSRRIQTDLANKTLEPTRVDALGSAVAVDVFWSRVAQLCR